MAGEKGERSQGKEEQDVWCPDSRPILFPVMGGTRSRKDGCLVISLFVAVWFGQGPQFAGL